MVQCRSEHAARAPAELVAKRTKGDVRRGESTTERREGDDVPAFSMQLVDERDGGAVINTGVQPDLVEQQDSGGAGTVWSMRSEKSEMKKTDQSSRRCISLETYDAVTRCFLNWMHSSAICK